MEFQTIRVRGPLDATVTPPGSKSITNRALNLAALSEGKTVLEGALDCEDTQLFFAALAQLGLDVTHEPALARMTIEGQGGVFKDCRPNGNSERVVDIYVGNSGTTARFLSAMLAFSHGNFRLHGKPRMHQRPIGDLLDALAQLGTDVICENDNRCPPLKIRGIRGQSTEIASRNATVSGAVSSQFLSALLMAAPAASLAGPVNIAVSGEIVSKPYIDMTLAMMNDFGVHVEINDEGVFHFQAQTRYTTPNLYKIEPDASAASYFFASAAVCGGSVTVPGLSRQSLQGDVAFADALEKMGCDVIWADDSIRVSRPPERVLQGISIDMNAFSDTAQTLAVVALFAESATEITNIAHVRHKETDRITDLAAELRKFGAKIEERRDGLRIVPPASLSIAEPLATYDDHRMAMSFAVAGLRVPGVRILDPNCVQKTFPDFFDIWERLK